MSSRDPQDRQSATKQRGSSHKGDSGGGAKEKDNADPCDLLIDVDLEGVRKLSLASLQIGDSLDVRLEKRDGFQSAVCVASNGEVVGALSAFPGVAALINCLNKKHLYAVKITAITRSSCHVQGGRIS